MTASQIKTPVPLAEDDTLDELMSHNLSERAGFLDSMDPGLEDLTAFNIDFVLIRG